MDAGRLAEALSKLPPGHCGREGGIACQASQQALSSQSSWAGCKAKQRLGDDVDGTKAEAEAAGG
jgi:hypothetical protein